MVDEASLAWLAELAQWGLGRFVVPPLTRW